MSDIASGGTNAAETSRFTVEDTGSTTDASELATEGPGAATRPPTSNGPSAPVGDDDVAHVFDQTNGVVEGLDGDSDGTADSDLHAAGDRADENPAFDAFADTEAEPAPGTDDERRTGN